MIMLHLADFCNGVGQLLSMPPILYVLESKR